MWQQWINLILGLWIALSGYITLTAANMTLNLTLVGLAVAVLALWGALEHRSVTHGGHLHA